MNFGSLGRKIGTVLICIVAVASAADADTYYVVRKINVGTCTTSKGIGVQPGWERCSGPYNTEAEAKKWLTDHEEPDSTCKKERCDYKP